MKVTVRWLSPSRNSSRRALPAIPDEETLEIYAFMTAADESKHQHGAEVTLESVLQKAREDAAKKLAAISKP